MHARTYVIHVRQGDIWCAWCACACLCKIMLFDAYNTHKYMYTPYAQIWMCTCWQRIRPHDDDEHARTKAHSWCIAWHVRANMLWFEWICLPPDIVERSRLVGRRSGGRINMRRAIWLAVRDWLLNINQLVCAMRDSVCFVRIHPFCPHYSKRVEYGKCSMEYVASHINRIKVVII